MPDDAVARLARHIDATRKAEWFLVDRERVLKLRRQGACDLHRLCAEFVASLNGKLKEPVLDLAPLTYATETFRDSGPNLIQVSSQGRQLQIAFQATPELASTEKFLIPYILEGELRAYNQRMLQSFEVRSRMIFLCVENDRASWRFYDWRTAATGPLGRDLIANLLEQLF